MSFDDDTFTTEGGRYTWSYSQFEDRDDNKRVMFCWDSYLSDADYCAIDSNTQFTAAKKISHLESNYQVRNKLVKTLFQDDIEYSISVYAAEEKLPEEYLHVVKKNDCLEIMIRGFLKNTCKIDLPENILAELDRLIERVHANEDMAIVYDRVSEIQVFLHDTVDKTYGPGTQLNLPTTLVKNLLSAARLHLNIWDTKYQHSTDLFKIIELSRNASNNEIREPMVIQLPPGKSFFPTWRVRHLLPLSDFNRQEVVAKVTALMHIDESLHLDEFKQSALRIYSAKPPSESDEPKSI